MNCTVVYLKRSLVTRARKIRAMVSEQQLHQQVLLNTLWKTEEASSNLITAFTLAQGYQDFHLLWSHVTQTMTCLFF